MYICIYVYMYICIYVYIYRCIYVCMYVCGLDSFSKLELWECIKHFTSTRDKVFQ